MGFLFLYRSWAAMPTWKWASLWWPNIPFVTSPRPPHVFTRWTSLQGPCQTSANNITVSSLNSVAKCANVVQTRCQDDVALYYMSRRAQEVPKRRLLFARNHALHPWPSLYIQYIVSIYKLYISCYWHDIHPTSLRWKLKIMILQDTSPFPGAHFQIPYRTWGRQRKKSTLPETNKAPEKWCLEH